MANVVQIVVTVDNAQANAALATTSNALKQAGITAQTSSQQMTGAATRAGAGIQQLGGHATTSLDSVRLLSQEFGLRLPRALETMISRMPGVVSALQTVTGALAGFAVVEVIARVGEEIYDAYEKYVDLNAQAEKFFETMQKASREDFSNSRAIESTRLRLDQATSDQTTKPQQAAALQRQAMFDINPVNAVSDMYNAYKIQQEGVQAMGDMVKLTQKQTELDHQGALAQIEANHQITARMSKEQQITMEQDKQHKIAAENQAYTRKQDMAVGNPAPANDGATERRTAEQTADVEAARKRVELSDQTSLAIMRTQDPAAQAGLQGQALYDRKRSDSIRELTQELVASGEAAQIPARVAAINEQYDNERLTRARELTAEAAKLKAQAAAAGLEGVPQIAANLQTRLAEINAAQTKMSGGAALSPDEQGAFDTMRGAANQEAISRREKLDQDYTDFVRQQVAARTDAELNSYDRIGAAAARERAAAQDQYNKRYVGPDGVDRGSDANRAQLTQQTGAIDSSAVASRAQLTQQINEETLQMDREAAQAERRVRASGLQGWVADYRSSLAEIQAADQAMRAKIDQEQHKTGGDPTQYEQRKVDADRTANAQIAELNQQLRQQIAGTLQGAFDDPVHYIQSKMKAMFFQILADFLMQSKAFKSLFGTTMGDLRVGGQPGGQGGIAGGATTAIERSLGIATPAGGTAVQAAGVSRAVQSAVGTGTGAGTGYSASAASAPSSFGSSISGASTSSSSDLGTGYSSTFSLAGVPSSGGGTASSPAGVLGSASTLGQTGLATAAALSSGTSSTPAAMGISSAANDSYTGEDGGFAGYLTGDADAGASTALANAAGGRDVNSAAAGQVQSANQNLAAAGLGDTAGSQALGVMGAAVDAYSGTKGVIGAFESGKPSGILSGSTSGAELGGSLGMLAGPLGGAIGAGIGAVGGAAAGLIGWATGEGGNLGGENYYKKTIQPQMDAAELAYVRGGGDAISAISQIDKIASDGFLHIGEKFGASAANHTRAAYIDKERERLDSEINRMAGAGRDYTSRSAVQFHTGGRISGFGDLATSSNEGFIHALMDETVMNPTASSTHGSTLAAMNSGASQSEIATMYLKSSGGGGTASAAAGDTHYHSWDVNAVDANSFEKMLTSGGGIQAINRASTKYNTRYAGDADNG